MSEIIDIVKWVGDEIVINGMHRMKLVDVDISGITVVVYVPHPHLEGLFPVKQRLDFYQIIDIQHRRVEGDTIYHEFWKPKMKVEGFR